MLPRIGDIRRIGSASLDLCFVSAGRLDGYFEVGLNAVGLGGWSADRRGGRLRRQRATGSASRKAGCCGGRRVMSRRTSSRSWRSLAEPGLTDQHCACADDGDGVFTVPGGATAAWVT